MLILVMNQKIVHLFLDLRGPQLMETRLQEGTDIHKDVELLTGKAGGLGPNFIFLCFNMF